MGLFRTAAAAVRRFVPGTAPVAEAASPPAETPSPAAAGTAAASPPAPPPDAAPRRGGHVLDELRRRPGAPNDEAAFLAWCNERDPSEPPGLSRYLFAVWRSREDLNEAFPGVYLDPDARLRLQLWAHHFLVSEVGAPPELVPSAPDGITDIAAPPLEGPPPLMSPGIVVVGYLRAILGLGEAGRRLAGLCVQAGERVRALPYDHTESPLGIAWPDPDPADIDPLDIVILAVNGSEASRARRALGAPQVHGRYVIGLWFWELDELPPYMAAGFDAVDEVWVTSEFTAEAVRAAAPTRVRVEVLPLGTVVPPVPTEASAALRQRFGIAPTATVVGTMFDYASRIERKNPVALIEAWIAAFPEPDPDRRVLFLKTINGPDFADQQAIVLRAANGRADIAVHDENLSADDREALVVMFDVVASLHRSEGYGLLLLDAMARAKPVIATGYSGNLAFMTPDNAWLVPHTMETLDVDTGPYRAGGRWAAPDVTAASAALRSVVNGIDTAAIRERALRGAADVASLIDGSAGVAFVRKRLSTIRRERAAQRER